MWFRYSENVGGDTITFLRHFCGKSFPEAVEYLLQFQGRARDSPIVPLPVKQKEKKPFALPPANSDQRRVFAYLRKRRIAAQVIQGFVQAGLLYEGTKYHLSGGIAQGSHALPASGIPMTWAASRSRAMWRAATRISPSACPVIRPAPVSRSLKRPSIS